LVLPCEILRAESFLTHSEGPLRYHPQTERRHITKTYCRTKFHSS